MNKEFDREGNELDPLRFYRSEGWRLENDRCLNPFRPACGTLIEIAYERWKFQRDTGATPDRIRHDR